MLLFFNYLDARQTETIRKYKYNSIDSSPVSNYITKPFWNWLVKTVIPPWVSPNILTLFSLLFLSLAYLIVDLHDNNFCIVTYQSKVFHPIPGWVWFMVAICCFLSHTLDGVDGIQARTLNISTPMGELLDHGCDSLSLFLFSVIFMSSLYVCGSHGISLARLVAHMGSLAFLFYLSHWEKYITGTLFLPWGYDFSFILAVFFFLFLPLMQPLPMFSLFPSLSLLQYTEILLQSAIWIISVPVSLYHIFRSPGDKSLIHYFRPAGPVLTLNILFLVLLNCDSTSISLHPKYVLWLYGIISSNLVCRLIVAQMTDSAPPLFNSLFIPLVVFVGCLILTHFRYLIIPVPTLEGVLVTFVVISTLLHLHYFASLIYQLRNIFGTLFFVVPKKSNNGPV